MNERAGQVKIATQCPLFPIEERAIAWQDQITVARDYTHSHSSNRKKIKIISKKVEFGENQMYCQHHWLHTGGLWAQAQGPYLFCRLLLSNYYTAVDRNDGCYYGKLCKLHLTFLNMSLWKNSILMSPQIGIGWLGSNINPLSHFLPFEPNIGRWMIMKMTTTLRK